MNYRLTLSQDLVFGSEGTAQADFERMEEINTEIGLTAVLNRGSPAGGFSHSGDLEKEKLDTAAVESR